MAKSETKDLATLDLQIGCKIEITVWKKFGDFRLPKKARKF